MKHVAIIQARMGSSRFPGKVLEDVGGAPMLERVVSRTARARRVDAVVVATTSTGRDDVIKKFCEREDVPCYRGSEADILDRYRSAAEETGAAVIIRVTADCPLIDPAVIDRVVDAFHGATGTAYASNINPPTYPDGLDTEVFSREALERAWREAALASEREHVTPYIRNHPEIFESQNVTHESDLSHLRWTVDEARDLAFVRRVHEALGPHDFGMEEVLALLDREPDLAAINAGIQRNEGYLKSLEHDKVMEKRGI